MPGYNGWLKVSTENIGENSTILSIKFGTKL